MIDISLIRQIPIENWLASRGIEPVRQNGHDLWYHSPLRQGDRTPSFVVHRNSNFWKDFSSGEGGSIIDLAMHLNQRPYIDTIMMLSDFAPEAKQYTPMMPALGGPGDGTATPRSFELLKVKPFGGNQSLVDYVRQRNIDPSVAARYGLQEVYYLNSRGRRCFALGFPNDSGGYEIRNPYFKGTIGNKAITTISSKDPSVAAVFEGFTDYLSYRQLHPEFSGMAVVLNSTALAERAVPVLQECREVTLLLDNDAAGNEKTAEITARLAQLAPSCQVKDGRAEYAAHNDLNDYLRASSGKGKTARREEVRRTAPVQNKADKHKSHAHKF